MFVDRVYGCLAARFVTCFENTIARYIFVSDCVENASSTSYISSVKRVSRAPAAGLTFSMVGESTTPL